MSWWLDFNVTMSARFWLGSHKSGWIGMTSGWAACRDSQTKVNEILSQAWRLTLCNSPATGCSLNSLLHYWLLFIIRAPDTVTCGGESIASISWPKPRWCKRFFKIRGPWARFTPAPCSQLFTQQGQKTRRSGLVSECRIACAPAAPHPRSVQTRPLRKFTLLINHP